MSDSAKNETYQMKIEEGKNAPRSVWKGYFSKLAQIKREIQMIAVLTLK